MELQNWQIDLMGKISGISKGELFTILSGRRTGKSMLNNFYQQEMQRPAIRILDSATVDGEIWYTVQCKPSLVSGWIQEQDSNMWVRHNDQRWQQFFNVFDMHEKLYTALQLKWGGQ